MSEKNWNSSSKIRRTNRYPYISGAVSYTHLGSYSDYSQQMNAMITAGEAPDVFQLGYDQGCSFYKKNLLTDWTDKAAADSEFMDGFYEGTVDGWQYDGKTYGLPGLVNVYGVFYNKDILANAGLDEPSVDWTWDDLFEYAEKLKDPSANKFGLYRCV